MIVLVGNGPSALKKKLGDKIDRADYVVRLNNFQTVGYEDFVGEKIDMWARNCARDVRTPSVIHELDAVLLCPVWSRPKNAWSKYAKYMKLLRESRAKLWMCTPRLLDELRDEMGYKRSPTTGAVTLKWLLQWYQVVHLVGFDHFQVEQQEGKHHYFGEKRARENPGRHNGLKEKEWFELMVGEGRAIYL